jgi:hypothetical protein
VTRLNTVLSNTLYLETPSTSTQFNGRCPSVLFFTEVQVIE